MDDPAEILFQSFLLFCYQKFAREVNLSGAKTGLLHRFIYMPTTGESGWVVDGGN